MNNGDTTDSAASRLRHLTTYLREHPATGPAVGHNPNPVASTPLSLGTLSHVDASVRELTDLVRKANPAAGPAPSRADGIYDWAREQTEHAPDAVRQRRETAEYRQYLEHAIRAGDWRKVIRPHRCPECRTFGLMWQGDMQRALCTNTDCTDPDGFSTAVTLARIAHEHIAGRQSKKTSAG
ncbi:hypothetical protein SUDANB145_07291 (plasmid) [Streptomyces sp. enrichment culture]|uniref:hypothetical protein n=1 Tax=Streptomyces sp. enrichment culture TaxID=1795815 RepID=UPI003F54A424